MIKNKEFRLNAKILKYKQEGQRGNPKQHCETQRRKQLTNRCRKDKNETTQAQKPTK